MYLLYCTYNLLYMLSHITVCILYAFVMLICHDRYRLYSIVNLIAILICLKIFFIFYYLFFHPPVTILHMYTCSSGWLSCVQPHEPWTIPHRYLWPTTMDFTSLSLARCECCRVATYSPLTAWFKYRPEIIVKISNPSGPGRCDLEFILWNLPLIVFSLQNQCKLTLISCV